MSVVIPWMAAEVGRPEEANIAAGLLGDGEDSHPSTPPPCARGRSGQAPSTSSGQAFSQERREVGHPTDFSQETREADHPAECSAHGLPAHQFPARPAEEPEAAPVPMENPEEQERRVYRGRTVAMLQRYMRYAIETGRLPSILGREFFRAKVTKYTVVTFEDRVIFVHDMEMCLERLDEFSRQLIARHILQEHDRWATARLLHCNEKTVRRLTPFALDQLSEIMLEVGLMERIGSRAKNSCQGGQKEEISLSDCEDGKNKF